MEARATSASLRHGGRRLGYIVYPSPAAAPGIPLILIHGFMAHAHWWDAVAPYLAENRKVVAIDLAGMGDSDPQSPYRYATFVDDVLAILDTLRIERCAIAGHSFGGLIAGLFCAAHGARVARFIAIDSNLGVFSQRANVDTSVNRRYYPTLEAALSRFRLVPPSLAADPVISDHIARRSVVRHPEGWTWKFDPKIVPDLSQDDKALDLADISVPTDYIYGQFSDIATSALVEQVTARLPQLRHVISIPECNHHTMVEQPIALVALIRFLLQQD
ncbi:MAG: alpha/beta fold hydrolase [Sphingobium sp.]